MCNKQIYETYERAKAAIKILKRVASDKTPVRAYHCPECGQWHITSLRFRWRNRIENKIELLITIDSETWKKSKIKKRWGVPTLPPKRNRKRF